VAERRKPTTTSNFGVGRRESHDASPFYARFTPPLISKEKHVARNGVVDEIYCHNAADMYQVASNSVALVVTSPPYFAGKEYEEALGHGATPASYNEYRRMLADVFRECVRVLEPGGRIAVNVANLGRRPYRSLAADVIAILQDDLRLLLRGEIVWRKAHGAGGSCAWGSFQSAANPVLRDVTERVVVASKGRFDRAMSRRERADAGLPSEGTVYKDEFMEATLDLWDIPSESATRVGHPAPFPVELPQRLIELYTYRDDVVLDPFMGSGTTAVAAVRTDRRFVGYDTDEDYVIAAKARVARERERIESRPIPVERPRLVAVPDPMGPDTDTDEGFEARAVREGQKAEEIARALLRDCGFEDFQENVRIGSGVEVDLTARDALGTLWYVDVAGAFTSTRAGLRRADTVWNALGKAAVLRLELGSEKTPPLLILTTDLPPRGSAAFAALRAGRGELFIDALEMRDPETRARLTMHASGVREPIGDLRGANEMF
jgi:site-specific DNA-methyltransferase (adenine-specific)